MSIPQYTTPTFRLVFTKQGLDLTQAHNVYVTFTSGRTEITKEGDSLEIGEKQIDVYLTQEETAKFMVGDVEIQANWTMQNGGRADRAASKIAKFEISKQLLRRVIE